MTKVAEEVKTKLWHGVNPLAGFLERVAPSHIPGWNSQHQYLLSSIERLRPKTVVEIGVWQGGSTVFMAKTLKRLNLDSVVISVDTWLGAWDHWLDANLFNDLKIEGGYPQLYKSFATHVVSHDVADYVVPLPLDSVNASVILQKLNIKVDMLHIDAAHDYRSVLTDLESWWPLLNVGGVFIGDDYSHDWPGVMQATDEFLAKNTHDEFQSSGGKCLAIKRG